ncbi:helix-turn-helix domain-containing protein [Nonomuraea polychroma]|uniref:helix-turn-helix domain-containing protein n=1 Tax=Nonomuraea polychroma TaxID=46176 RepID=UPI003D89EE59
MYDETTIGARLRTLRRWRGMTLAEVAGLAGVSVSFLSMAERGQRALDRRSYIAALASALRVSETDIVGGPHLSSDPVQAGPHTAIPAMRVALQTNTLAQPAQDEARPLDELVEAAHQLQEAFSRCDYVELGKQLPAVLDELHVHAAMPADEQAQKLALETLIEACYFATFRMKDLGYADLAYQAAARAEEAARLLDDPVAIGKAAYCRIQTMPREGSWSRTLTAAERAADALQPSAADPAGIQVLGMLTLTASLSAAVEHKFDTSRTWMDEARALAARIPDTPGSSWASFSATNVAIWGVAIAVESGEHGGAVLEQARAVNQTVLAPIRSRYASFLVDVGRGLARDPKTGPAALPWLLKAESVAPQRIRNSATVRETVAVMMEQARVAALGRELRGMASRMGMPH